MAERHAPDLTPQQKLVLIQAVSFARRMGAKFGPISDQGLALLAQLRDMGLLKLTTVKMPASGKNMVQIAPTAEGERVAAEIERAHAVVQIGDVMILL